LIPQAGWLFGLSARASLATAPKEQQAKPALDEIDAINRQHIGSRLAVEFVSAAHAGDSLKPVGFSD
jgi:hypothetical protein